MGRNEIASTRPDHVAWIRTDNCIDTQEAFYKDSHLYCYSGCLLLVKHLSHTKKIATVMIIICIRVLMISAKQ